MTRYTRISPGYSGHRVRRDETEAQSLIVPPSRLGAYAVRPAMACVCHELMMLRTLYPMLCVVDVVTLPSSTCDTMNPDLAYSVARLC